MVGSPTLRAINNRSMVTKRSGDAWAFVCVLGGVEICTPLTPLPTPTKTPFRATAPFSDYFGKEPCSSINPDEAVAIGQALERPDVVGVTVQRRHPGPVAGVPDPDAAGVMR